jgi:hypothetical protein
MVSNQTGIRTGYLAGRYPGMLGHLFSPDAQKGPFDFMPYALDNARYGAWAKGHEWSEPAWLRLLAWAKNAAHQPLWAAVPDRVTNREATIEDWHKYAPTVRAHGFRPAFVAQNGMSFDDVPDSECVIFIGGTVDWKEQAIEPWCARFPGRVHVGKVNATPRLMKCYRAGAISVDGTGWFRDEGYAGAGQREQLIEFLKMRTRERKAA